MSVKMRYGSKDTAGNPLEFQRGLSPSGLSFGTGVTLANGGYAKAGRLVVVNMRLTFSSNVAANTVVVSGLPKPSNTGGLPDSTACIPVAAATSSTWALRLNGELYNRNDVSSGSNVVIMTVYIEGD